MTAPDAAAGRKAPCPKCRTILAVPVRDAGPEPAEDAEARAAALLAEDDVVPSIPQNRSRSSEAVSQTEPAPQPVDRTESVEAPSPHRFLPSDFEVSLLGSE